MPNLNVWTDSTDCQYRADNLSPQTTDRPGALMTVLDQTTDLALSAAMREGSMAEHQAAEDSSFMSDLLSGRVNERGYADYLLRLRVVYSTMEAIVDEHRADPAVAAVADDALVRLAAIDADLDHWLSEGEDRTVDSPAADAYRQR